MKRILIGLFIFFMALTSVFGAITWQHFDFFKNSGGLNDAFAPTAIEDNEASNLQNVILTTYGSFQTRYGYAKLNSTVIYTGADCVGLTYYSPTSTSQYLITIFTNDKIYKMDYGAGTGPDGTWDDITGSLSFDVSNTNLCTFAVGEDTLLIEDGLNTTAPYKWTGTGNAEALGGGSPNATMVAYHKNMAFAAGNNTYPSLLYFTDVGNIANWTTGLSGNVAVETNDGSVIRAIIPGFDALYIFKDYSIWRLSGDDKDNFQLQRMVSGIGCRSPNAVKRIGNNFYFTDGQGNTYLYDGAIKVQLVSTKVQGTIDNSNYSRWKYVVTEQFQDDFYIAFSNTGSATNDKVLVFDSFNLAWVKFDGLNINAMCVADDGLGADMLVFGDYDGFVYKYPSGTSDSGTAISAYYQTKQFRFPEVNPEKDWKLLNVYAAQKGNYNLTVETKKDFETTGTSEDISLLGNSSLYGTAVFGTDSYGGQNIIVGRIEVNKEGKFFQVKFSNSNLDEPIEVKGYSIFVEPSDRL